jgi:hypothetical protein
VTRVCLVGEPDTTLRARLLAHEPAREALSTYDVETPWENTLCVETVSLGAAVSLLNDLNWYLVRYASDAWVCEPSVSADEWLTRSLAEAVRAEDLAPADTATFCRVYGVASGVLQDPLYARRLDDESLPEYDLAEVDDTVVVRVTEAEFDA